MALQRTHGLCLAMRQETETADLKYLANAVKTMGGIRRLQRKLRQTVQRECRTAA